MRHWSWLPTAVGLALVPAEEARAMDDPITCMSLGMYFEARDSGRPGMIAVGWVIRNRVAAPEFPDDVCAVVAEGGEQPPCQFSWWCDGKSDQPKEVEAWNAARAVAVQVLGGSPPDPTGGALYFHGAGIDPPWPELVQTAEVGGHLFYR